MSQPCAQLLSRLASVNTAQTSCSAYGNRRPQRARTCQAVLATPPVRETVKRNKLGSSDLEVSELCLGTMTFGEQNTEREAHEQLSLAVEHGINFLDTSELYPIVPNKDTQGRTSTYIGNWLKHQKRDKLVVATKVAGRNNQMTWIPANRTVPRGKEEPCIQNARQIRAAAEGEMRRLQTDYIDLLQLHWPDRYKPGFGTNQYRVEREWDYTPFEEQVAAVGELIREGKVRQWGLSNETTFGLMSHVAACDAQGVPRPVTIQNSFSLIHRSFESELAEACSPRHLNVGLLPWSALAGGALTGKYLNGAMPSVSERPRDVLQDAEKPRKGARMTLFPTRYARFVSSRSHDAAAAYIEIAQEAGITPAQLAYAFCKSRWYIPSVIIGATKTSQLLENIATAGIELSEETLAAIDEVHVNLRDPSLLD